jgi:hypothetical protein
MKDDGTLNSNHNLIGMLHSRIVCLEETVSDLMNKVQSLSLNGEREKFQKRQSTINDNSERNDDAQEEDDDRNTNDDDDYAVADAGPSVLGTNNNAGFCVGDKVKLFYDWKKQHRESLKGAVGNVTKVSPQYVWISIASQQTSVQKKNHNVMLVEPTPGRETVTLPNNKKLQRVRVRGSVY